MAERQSEADLLKLSRPALEREADVLLKNAGYTVRSERDMLRSDIRRGHILRKFIGEPGFSQRPMGLSNVGRLSKNDGCSFCRVRISSNAVFGIDSSPRRASGGYGGRSWARLRFYTEDDWIARLVFLTALPEFGAAFGKPVKLHRT